jgi:hypothetical protein
MSLSGSVGNGGEDDKVVDARGMMIPFEQRFRTNGQMMDDPLDKSRLNSSSLSISTRKKVKIFSGYVSDTL